MPCEQLAVLRLVQSGPVGRGLSQRLQTGDLSHVTSPPQAFRYPGKEVLAVTFQGHQDTETVECL